MIQVQFQRDKMIYLTYSLSRKRMKKRGQNIAKLILKWCIMGLTVEKKMHKTKRSQQTMRKWYDLISDLFGFRAQEKENMTEKCNLEVQVF